MDRGWENIVGRGNSLGKGWEVRPVWGTVNSLVGFGEKRKMRPGPQSRARFLKILNLSEFLDSGFWVEHRWKSDTVVSEL